MTRPLRWPTGCRVSSSTRSSSRASWRVPCSPGRHWPASSSWWSWARLQVNCQTQGRARSPVRGDARRQGEPVQHRTRGDEIEARLLGVLLETRGGVEDVADEDDLLPQVAQLTGGDLAAVEAAAEDGARPEVALVAGRVARDRGADQEEAADAVGRPQAPRHRPGDDDLVARVLVDLSLGLEHGLGQVVHHAAEQLEVPGAAEALRELGRAGQVHEQEDALLRLGPRIDAGHEVPQYVAADHTA